MKGISRRRYDDVMSSSRLKHQSFYSGNKEVDDEFPLSILLISWHVDVREFPNAGMRTYCLVPGWRTNHRVQVTRQETRDVYKRRCVGHSRREWKRWEDEDWRHWRHCCSGCLIEWSWLRLLKWTRSLRHNCLLTSQFCNRSDLHLASFCKFMPSWCTFLLSVRSILFLDFLGHALRSFIIIWAPATLLAQQVLLLFL